MKQIFLAAVVLVLGVPFAARAADGTPKRPNVLFIMVDDLNHWVGYLGRNKQTITPNMDRLSAAGMSFTRANCAAPVCNPSRTALFSGLRPGSTGVYGNAHDWRPVVPEEKTMITTLRKGGYTPSQAGGSHRIFRFVGRDFINLQYAGGMAKSYQVRQVREQLSKHKK